MLQAIIEDKLFKITKTLSPDITEESFDRFKNALSRYFDHISTYTKEERFKKYFLDFLKEKISSDYFIDIGNDTDWVIRNGIHNTDKPIVLSEAKRAKNKSEMITKDNLNATALHELILYFMRERDKGNIDIKTLIIHTQTEFFIFDASDFENIFYQNTKFRKNFEEWQKGQKITSNTKLFYNNIAKPFIEESNNTIRVIHFDLNDYKQYLLALDTEPNTEIAQKKLLHLYKIFSAEFLFNKHIYADSNSLNQEFYNELLYIVGLHEVTKNGKNTIERLPEHERNQASILENTIFKIKLKHKFNKPQTIKRYGENIEERSFNIALELCLLWINRILFLKLLEAQIVSSHKGAKEYKFLNINTVTDYSDLFDLFFEILAKRPNERSPHLQKKFNLIPYLNSSLFESDEALEEIFGIHLLNNHFELPLYHHTVLVDKKGKKRHENLRTLDYLFQFLDSFNFGSDTETEIKEKSKTIINAAVLGLIFEKINGYKDGSIFTPSYITMFMSRQVIEQVIIDKFNTKYTLDMTSFAELKNYVNKNNHKIDKIRDYNTLINEIKICDPSVGSGHFLVSCLNQLIDSKYQLGILADTDGNVIKGYAIHLENDEIIIIDRKTGEPYQYHIPLHKSLADETDIQKILFHEKKTLIENCLFGVDINKNSVNICQLRLWIELLKNAYYKAPDYKELETLPNIDINIKHGNSLLSRFNLDASLDNAFKSVGLTLEDYKKMVSDYKNTDKKKVKYDLNSTIINIKNHFRKDYTDTLDRDIRILEQEIKDFDSKPVIKTDFFQTDKEFEIERKNEFKELKNKLAEKKEKRDSFDNDRSIINRLEWRFEFPEILDNKDETFIGFDIIIGNPPYIQLQRDGGGLGDIYASEKFETFAKTGDIYMLFYERGYNLLAKNGYLSYITSNKWLRAGYGECLRRYICHKTQALMMIDLGANVFDSATVDSNILWVQKTENSEKSNLITASCLQKENLKKMKSHIDFSELVEKNIMPLKISTDQWIILNDTQITIKDKLKTIGKPLKDWNIEINRGILTGYNEAFIIDTPTKEKLCLADPKSIEILKPIVRGRDIKKWKADYQGLWIITTFPALNINIDDYPAVKKYLEGFGEKLHQIGKELINKQGEKEKTRKKTSNKWFETSDNIAYHKNFEQEKIIYPNMSKFLPFVYDETKILTNDKSFILVGSNLKYLVAILNSSVGAYWIKNNCVELGDGYELRSIFMQNLPIPNIPESEQAPFVDLTNRILSLTQADDYSASSDKQKHVATLQEKIDTLVYALYGLTADEVKVIEGA